ncbi:hypothetical protein [Ornithinimicrobium sp.]|uniref:hypothetical protein n=1 Tax=Ornithinimicrobium sp. TaxID=1977084 RepID=UPI003D9AD47B
MGVASVQDLAKDVCQHPGFRLRHPLGRRSGDELLRRAVQVAHRVTDRGGQLGHDVLDRQQPGAGELQRPAEPLVGRQGLHGDGR